MTSGTGRVLDIKSPIGETALVTANYTKLSENIRRLTPQGIQCSVFCGGTNCKYENPDNWTGDSLALQGIYSHWITSDILAMARPSTATIIKRNIIQQFQSLGIKSIINLQSPKEHASCGEPLEDSGFSYDPNIFMENNIYYYNFAWKDYGDATLQGLLNMVKVLAFAEREGKVAIHCHAGLGRTGVLIACYLVFALRVNATDAIKYVRLKRPGSVQTRGQILCVRHFAQFVLPQTITYFLRDNVSKDKYMTEFTLQKFLKRQQIALHGYDQRMFKHIPKIIHVICERILYLTNWNIDELASATASITNGFLYSKLTTSMAHPESTNNVSNSESSSPDVTTTYALGSLVASPNPSEYQSNSSQHSDSFSDLTALEEDQFVGELLIDNGLFEELELSKQVKEEHVEHERKTMDDVVNALLTDFSSIDADLKKTIMQMKNVINTCQSGWSLLKVETDLIILAGLLFDWLEGLKNPVLGKEHFEKIVIYYNQTEECFKKFAQEEAYLIEYLLRFLLKLQPLQNEDREKLLIRFVASLAHQTVIINNQKFPEGRDFIRLREGTLKCSIHFFQSLLELINLHCPQNTVSNFIAFEETSNEKRGDVYL